MASFFRLASSTTSRGYAHLSRGDFRACAQLLRVARLQEALDLVNDHEVGNGVSLLTRDGDTPPASANQVKVGMVGINVPIPVPMAFDSFGGWKRSLFGDHNVHGMEGAASIPT